MNENDRLRPNTPMVISEILENEVVLVNFDSGSYYSLGGSGTEIWRSLEGGAAAVDVTDAVLSQFEGPEAEIERAVSDFLDELIKEELIVIDGTVAHSAAPAGRGAELFTPPKLERFDDMRDMLLLDPIHDVDDSGWPRPAPNHP